jgi:hypothetical protein
MAAMDDFAVAIDGNAAVASDDWSPARDRSLNNALDLAHDLLRLLFRTLIIPMSLSIDLILS